MHRTKAALMMALLGAFLFVAVVMQDIRRHPEIAPGDFPWGLMIRYFIAMILGGALSGFVFSGLFGRSSIFGWLLSFLSGVIAAAFSGLIGSAIGLLPDMIADGLSTGELIQIGAGLLVLPFSIAEKPWLAIPVVALLLVTHVWCRSARQAQTQLQQN